MPLHERHEPIELVLGRLEKVRPSSHGYTARCPAHDDRHPSLSVRRGDDGRVLLHCHAGCSIAGIVASLGLTASDLFANAAERSGETRYGYAAHRPLRGVSVSRPSAMDVVPPPDPRLSEVAEAAHRDGAARLPSLAGWLGVTVEALEALCVGWINAKRLASLETRCRSAGAWTFPMRDTRGRVVGVRLRADDGFKWSIRGGRQGLFAPTGIAFDLSLPLIIAEGASDVAALLTVGLQSIGLPAAGQAGDLLVDLLCRLRPQRVLVLADADDAGEAGADAIARLLAAGKPEEAVIGIGCRVASLPFGKDARDYLRQGGDAAGITNLLDRQEGGCAS